MKKHLFVSFGLSNQEIESITNKLGKYIDVKNLFEFAYPQLGFPTLEHYSIYRSVVYAIDLAINPYYNIQMIFSQIVYLTKMDPEKDAIMIIVKNKKALETGSEKYDLFVRSMAVLEELCDSEDKLFIHCDDEDFYDGGIDRIGTHLQKYHVVMRNIGFITDIQDSLIYDKMFPEKRITTSKEFDELCDLDSSQFCDHVTDLAQTTIERMGCMVWQLTSNIKKRLENGEKCANMLTSYIGYFDESRHLNNFLFFYPPNDKYVMTTCRNYKLENYNLNTLYVDLNVAGIAHLSNQINRLASNTEVKFIRNAPYREDKKLMISNLISFGIIDEEEVLAIVNNEKYWYWSN